MEDTWHLAEHTKCHANVSEGQQISAEKIFLNTRDPLSSSSLNHLQLYFSEVSYHILKFLLVSHTTYYHKLCDFLPEFCQNTSKVCALSYYSNS